MGRGLLCKEVFVSIESVRNPTLGIAMQLLPPSFFKEENASGLACVELVN